LASSPVAPRFIQPFEQACAGFAAAVRETGAVRPFTRQAFRGGRRFLWYLAVRTCPVAEDVAGLAGSFDRYRGKFDGIRKQVGFDVFGVVQIIADIKAGTSSTLPM
jgi:hypothetical protein